MLENTPLGPISLAVTARGLLRVSFGTAADLRIRFASRLGAPPAPDLLAEALHQMVEYLEGQRRAFTLPLEDEELSEFELAVRRAALAIPYGQTTTYRKLAVQIGSPDGARAVGIAMSRNPLPLVVPCHRVVAASGKLHGYSGAGGPATKAWLLQLEGQRLVA